MTAVLWSWVAVALFHVLTETVMVLKLRTVGGSSLLWYICFCRCFTERKGYICKEPGINIDHLIFFLDQ